MKPPLVKSLVLALLVLVAACRGPLDPEAAIAEAQEAREKKEYAAALIGLKDVLQRSPEYAEARYLLGVIYNETGDYKTAEQELRRARELGFDPVKVIPEHGRALLMTGAFKEVLDQVRVEGETTNRVQADVLTLRAKALIGLGRRGEAGALLNEALAKYPEFPDALLAQARLSAADRQIDEAKRLIERAIASAPKYIEAWLMKGEVARLTGDNQAAAAAYKEVLTIDPGSVIGIVNSARIQIASGDFDRARKQLAELRKRAPNLPMRYYLEALLSYRQSNYAAARTNVQQVLKISPDHLESLLLAGLVELALGSDAQAQAYLARLIEHAPRFLHARRALIASLVRSNQLPRAIQEVEKALSLAPQDAATLALAGDVYLKSNEYTKAGSLLEAAAKLEPKNVDVRTLLGVSQLARGEVDRALADLEMASTLKPEMHRADILLVLTHLERKSYDEALRAVKTLESKRPEDPLTFNLKGLIHVGRKDSAAARRDFERALQLKATYVEAAANLAQLDIEEKKPEAARQRLEAILRKDKDNVQALIVLANLGPRIGASQKEQIGWLERAQNANAGSVEAALMLAALHARMGNTAKALETVQKTNAANPDNPRVLNQLGMMQVAAGMKEQGLATFNRLIAAQPDSPISLLHLAGAQAANGNYGAAAGTLKKSLAIKPGFVEAQAALGDLEIRGGRFAEARGIASQLQKQVPNSALGFILEGDSWMAEKNLAQAVQAYEAAVRTERNATTVIKLHAAYTSAGKPQDADRLLAEWLEQSPDNVGTRLYIADTELKRGKYKDAIAQYESLRRSQPDNVALLNNLAWAYQQVKDPRALDMSRRAYQLMPEAAGIADTFGWILVEQGDARRGLEVLQRAVATAPEAPEIRYHLAQAWLRVGDKPNARSELERLLSSNKPFRQRAEAQSLLDQLNK